jgi:hypothetical protein
MSMHRRVDPALAAPLEAWYQAMQGGINLHDIPTARRLMADLAATQMATARPLEGISTADWQVPGPEGAPEVFVRLYQPTARPATLPALLWIHGGGYVLGSVAGDDLVARHLAQVAQCVVASVEYRLAPECRMRSQGRICRLSALTEKPSPGRLFTTSVALNVSDLDSICPFSVARISAARTLRACQDSAPLRRPR